MEVEAGRLLVAALCIHMCVGVCNWCILPAGFTGKIGYRIVDAQSLIAFSVQCLVLYKQVRDVSTCPELCAWV